MNKMSFEELVDKFSDNICDDTLHSEILTRHADLQAYKADIENAIKGAMDDNPNEKHCSCVPLLKVKIKQLEEKVRVLEAENKGLISGQHQYQDLCGDLQAQTEQSKRAIELVDMLANSLNGARVNDYRFDNNRGINIALKYYRDYKSSYQPDGLTKGERG